MAAHGFTDTERLMVLYVLQNPDSPIYPHEFAFRLPVSENDAARFSARLAGLGWLYRTPRPVKKDLWHYGINPAAVPVMRLEVLLNLTPHVAHLARSCYLSLDVLYHPYKPSKPSARPQHRPAHDSAHWIHKLPQPDLMPGIWPHAIHRYHPGQEGSTHQHGNRRDGSVRRD